MALTLGVAAVVAVLMEGWAAWLHRALWHGVLWPAHRSHHPEAQDNTPTAKGSSPKRKRSTWEFNDVFGLAHACVAAPLIVYGLTPPFATGQQLALGLGYGMSAFGLAYALVHDGLVHGRLPVGVLRRSAYMRRVVAAHRVHHKLGGHPYGLFSGPWVLRREQAGRKGARSLGAARLVDGQRPR